MTGPEVHPAAEFFPLMAESELRELADDIAANGLRQPIVLDPDGRILDGRNREAACRLAGVSPRYETADGGDPTALVISLNVRRRNLSASQRAIAAAEAWGLAEAEGRVRARGRPEKRRKSSVLITTPAQHFAALFGTNEKFVQQARALVARDPDAAAAVKAGVAPLAEAVDSLRRREARTQKETRQVSELRAEFPDLAEAVAAETMSLEAALGDAAKRRADREQTSRILTQNVSQAVALLQMNTDDDAVAADLERFRGDYASAGWSWEAAARACAYLTKFVEQGRGSS